MPESVELILADEAATLALGADLARALTARQDDYCVIYLVGDLGAGKTTFARGFLSGLGHRGRVPSPTYTLIEPYEIGAWRVFHIDLYRLEEPREVAELGIPELLGPATLLLIEWPERGAGELPPADLRIAFKLADSGRQAVVSAGTDRIAGTLAQL